MLVPFTGATLVLYHFVRLTSRNDKMCDSSLRRPAEYHFCGILGLCTTQPFIVEYTPKVFTSIHIPDVCGMDGHDGWM